MREPQQLHFESHDGTKLFYRHWPATAGPGNRALVLFHRGHEHSGRVQHIVDEFDLPEFAMFAWDARGHGRSPGPRGHSPSLGTSIKDVDTFVRHVDNKHGIPAEHVGVVAQSIGSVLATAWAHDYAPRVRCMVLASPAFRVKLYIPFARLLLKVRHALFGNFFINSYVKAWFLTHDPERAASYDADPLITRAISVNILLSLYEAAERVIADAAAIRVPILLLVSGSDWVVSTKPSHRFFDRVGSDVKERHVFPGFYHDTLGEKDRHLAIAKAREFIVRAFSESPRRDSLLEADREGYTRDEFDTLRAPLTPLSPKAIYFAALRGAMRIGGKLSSGLRLGWQTGFDSGSTLDYVYRDTPAGRTPLGRLIDRLYLDSVGWRGIRVRKRHLERLLGDSVGRLRAAGRPVRIVDIAAGHGRYVLEALDKLVANGDRILLRDYSDINVRSGAALIAEKGMGDFARFDKGDAFDAESLAAIRPRPTLGVVSGLYELFPSNRRVQESLAGLARMIEPGGLLVYTGQPWHPQLELIARTLTSHRDGAPWVMRRRTQAELDELVEAAGFEKLDQLTDDWGIFTVSLARRLGA